MIKNVEFDNNEEKDNGLRDKQKGIKMSFYEK